MNIFFLHTCPEIAAINLNYPKLQNKMILESVQLLTTTLNVNGVKTIYNSTHVNHPSRLWLQQSTSNIHWLIRHIHHLGKLYTEKTGKTYKSETVLNKYINDLFNLDTIPNIGLTLPHLAMNKAPQILEKYSKVSKLNLHVANSLEDAVSAYREYMVTKDYWKSEYQFIDG